MPSVPRGHTDCWRRRMLLRLILQICYTDPANLTRSRRIPWHLPFLIASASRKRPTKGNVPDPESEAVHGKAVSVEDSHRQPYAASGNADADLRLRSATVGRSRQTTGVPDLDLRVPDRRGRTGFLRLRLGPARPARGYGRWPGLFAV